MVVITVNTGLDSKEKIQKVIEELQAILKQKERFQTWRPAAKTTTTKKPSANDLLKEVDKIPASSEDKRDSEQFKKIKLERY